VVKFASIMGLKDQRLDKGLIFFPNPCKNDFVVNTKLFNEKISIFIYDLNGKILHSQQQISAEKKANFKINLDDGVYVLKIKYQDNTEVLSELIITN